MEIARSWMKIAAAGIGAVLVGGAMHPVAADLSGVGLPQSAARLPFGLSDTADPLGGLGRPRDALDDPIREDFDSPIYRLTPGNLPGPAPGVRPAPPVSPVPVTRPEIGEER